MAFRLTPRDDRFYAMFAAAAANLVTAAGLLGDQLAATLDVRPEIAARMHDVEHAADEATHEIFSTVNSTFVTPFDREDIYALAGRIDDVMDHMDAAADLIVLYRLASCRPSWASRSTCWAGRELTPRRCRGCGRRRSSPTTGSRSTGSRTRPTASTGGCWPLFSGMYEPMEVMKLKEVVEELEAAADAFEHVATPRDDRGEGSVSAATTVIGRPGHRRRVRPSTTRTASTTRRTRSPRRSRPGR